MSDAFTLLQKNNSLSKGVNSEAFAGLAGKSEQIEMINRVTDQNVRNVFSALEKHKLLLEDRFSRYEVQAERLKAQVKQLETDVEVNQVTSAKIRQNNT